MTDLSHGIWAAATASVAFAGHQVAITWLNQRAAKSQRDEARDEREQGVTARLEAIADEFKSLKLEVKTFLANQRAR